MTARTAILWAFAAGILIWCALIAIGEAAVRALA